MTSGVSKAKIIMLKVLEEALPELIYSEEGKEKLNKVVPFYKKELNKKLFRK